MITQFFASISPETAAIGLLVVFSVIMVGHLIKMVIGDIMEKR